jgi:hypothetical protein
MHEETKVEEAEYFLRRIAAVTNDPKATRHETSAFLTAARSVLQYVLEEAKTKSGGQAWYDRSIQRDPVVKFLKDHRDINVHLRPLPLRTNITVYPAAAEIRISNTTNVVEQYDWRSVTELRPPSYDYKFKGWPGAEDVLPLATRYLDEIKQIVADGRRLGFLSP